MLDSRKKKLISRFLEGIPEAISEAAAGGIHVKTSGKFPLQIGEILDGDPGETLGIKSEVIYKAKLRLWVYQMVHICIFCLKYNMMHIK